MPASGSIFDISGNDGDVRIFGDTICRQMGSHRAVSVERARPPAPNDAVPRNAPRRSLSRPTSAAGMVHRRQAALTQHEKQATLLDFVS
jgi:hypothetical protein